MPWIILAAGLALVAVVSFLVHSGAVAAQQSASWLPVVVLVAFAVVFVAGLMLWHVRKSRELIVARYHLRGDALGWRKTVVQLGTAFRVCAECGAIVPDFRAQEEHADWHEQLAVLIANGGELPEEDYTPPWTAVTDEEPAEVEQAARQT